MPYSGNAAFLTARIPIEIMHRLDAKAQELDMTRSTLVRRIFEIVLLTPGELAERQRRANAICEWIRNGADPANDPEDEWNPPPTRPAPRAE